MVALHQEEVPTSSLRIQVGWEPAGGTWDVIWTLLGCIDSFRNHCYMVHRYAYILMLRLCASGSCRPRCPQPLSCACHSMPRFFFSTVKQCQLHKLLCTEICGFKTQNNKGEMGIKRKGGGKPVQFPRAQGCSRCHV